tara:strand:+ start:3786 stop:4907 length:1122 start_codon:yes stop_codon:yes gene_type:complete
MPGAFVSPSVNQAQIITSTQQINEHQVRMSGDGLGLAPVELARLWTELAEDGRIQPDSYSNGGSVEILEDECARILGKERAVFMPTGTLANQLAVRALSGGVGRVVVQQESHLYNDSGDCVQTLSGLNLIPLGRDRSTFTLDELQEAVTRSESGRVPTPVTVISIESPVRRRYGECFDERELSGIVEFAKRRKIGLHLDGARLFLQSAYTGRSVEEYAALFDTVYVSLYKYFNAPSGAILAGPRNLLDDMFHTRRMFGAGLPAAWPFASIATRYLIGFTERFRDAISTSESVIKVLQEHDSFQIQRRSSGTNLFTLRLLGREPGQFLQNLEVHGITDVRRFGAANEFLLSVNETWNRTDAESLARRFVSAVEG